MNLRVLRGSRRILCLLSYLDGAGGPRPPPPPGGGGGADRPDPRLRDGEGDGGLQS